MPRKPRQTVSAEDILKQMYPDLPSSDDYVQENPATKQTQNQPNVDPQVAELKAQLAALQAQVQTQTKTASALMSQAVQDMPPQMPQIDYSRAPDPVEDPKGFAEFNMRATQQLLAWKEADFEYKQRQRTTTQTRNDILWDKFTKDYPAYAENDERVGIAAEMVVKRAVANGTDPDKYMYGNSAGFMQDVVHEIDRLWGKPQTGVDTDDDDIDDDEPATRTDGLFGGSGQSGDATSKSKAPPSQYGALSQELMAWQEKTGYKR